MPEVNIRAAQKADLPRIKSFLKVVDRDFYPSLSERGSLGKMSRRFTLGKKYRCFLMESGSYPESLMGIAVYIKPWKTDSDAFIKILAVRPDIRGGGFGSMLRKEVLERISKEGAKEVYATTWSTYSRMIHINRKMGFRIHKIVKNDRGPGMHTLVFRKILKDVKPAHSRISSSPRPG